MAKEQVYEQKEYQNNNAVISESEGKKNPEEVWEINQKFFLEHEEEFKEKYSGLYVAVHNSEVLGTHEEIGHLVGRLYEKYGNIPLYANKIGEKVIRTSNWPLMQSNDSETIPTHSGT